MFWIIKWLTVVVVSLGRCINFFKGYKLSVTELNTSSGAYYDVIRKAFPNAKIDLKDAVYTYTNLNEWISVITLILTDLPKYRKHRYDCENHAFSAMVRASELCGLNSLLYIRGTNNKGNPHGFNGFLCEKGFYILESQSGIINSKGYKIYDVVDFGKLEPMITENVTEVIGA